MKYCIYYHKGFDAFKYFKEIDELNIPYNSKDPTLIDFMLKNKDKKFNLFGAYVKKDVDLFIQIKEKYPELDFTLAPEYYNSNDRDDFLSCSGNLPIYYPICLYSWDQFFNIININKNIKDIIITNELCFELDAIASCAHERNIRIRTIANIAQSTVTNIPPLKKFFIRPEDTYIYEPYIDVLEFQNTNSLLELETYYKIYNIDKKWYGNLREIISNFDYDLDSRFLLPSFAERRLKCGKRCFKGKPCRICEVTTELADTLKDKNLLIKDFEKKER